MSQTKENSGRKKVPCAHCLKEVPLSEAKVAEAALRQFELLTGGFMIRKLPSTMNVSSDRCGLRFQPVNATHYVFQIERSFLRSSAW